MRMRPVRTASIAVIMAVGMAACGSGQDDGPTVDEGGTLTFANWQWLEPERGDRILDSVSQYTEENPQVDIDPQEVARQNYENTMNTQMGGGSGPDILILPDSYLMEVVDAGLLEPLDDVLDPADAERLTAVNDFAQVDGEQLALSWETAPYALFWNQNLLDEAGVEPPTTPDELIDAAVAIEENTDAAGFAVRHQMNEAVPWWVDFGNWIRGFGGTWSDGENPTIDAPENIEAVGVFQEMYESGALTVGDDASTFRSRFSAGGVGMSIDNSAALLTMVDSEQLDSTDVGASPLPFPGSQSVHSGAYIGINAHSENKELAKDFLRWLFTEEAQQDLSSALAPSAVGTDTEIPPDLVDQHPWLPAFQEQLPDSMPAVIEGFETETPRIQTLVLTEIERMLTEGGDPAEALRTAQQKVEDAIQ